MGVPTAEEILKETRDQIEREGIDAEAVIEDGKVIVRAKPKDEKPGDEPLKH